MDNKHAKLVLQNLSLRNYRSFENTKIEFHDKLNVIIGINGSGKTSILECLAKMLEVYRLLMTDGSISSINWRSIFLHSDLRYGELSGYSEIKAKVSFPPQLRDRMVENGNDMEEKEDILMDQDTHWRVVFDKNEGWWGLASEEEENNDWSALDELAYRLRKIKVLFSKVKDISIVNKNIISIPIVVFFPSNSQLNVAQDSIDDTPHFIDSIVDMDKALSKSTISYNEFFRWFRWLHSKNRNEKENLIFNQISNKIINVLNDDLYDNILYSNLHINWENSINGELSVFKNDNRIGIAQLSEGEKRIIFIVSNIAYKLILANPESQNPLETGSGVVLIDEIDLHLHPQWESKIIGKIIHLFPAIQFIVTTHSPAVLQSVDRNNLIVIENGIVLEKSKNPFTLGRQFDEVGQDAFGLAVYPEFTDELIQLQNKIRKCYDLIDDNNIDDAELLLEQIIERKGDNDKDVLIIKNLIEFSKF